MVGRSGIVGIVDISRFILPHLYRLTDLLTIKTLSILIRINLLEDLEHE